LINSHFHIPMRQFVTVAVVLVAHTYGVRKVASVRHSARIIADDKNQQRSSENHAAERLTDENHAAPRHHAYQTPIEARFAPGAAYKVVERMKSRSCEQKLLEEFIDVFKLEGSHFDEAIVKAADEAQVVPRLFGIRTSLEVPLQPVMPSDGINITMYPKCSIGSDFVECARTMKPISWIRQIWEISDVHAMHSSKWQTVCPWCKKGTPKAAELKFVFTPGKDNGMHFDWANSSIRGVEKGSEAHRLGVVNGMRFLTVDGMPFSKARYDTVNAGSKHYEVYSKVVYDRAAADQKKQFFSLAVEALGFRKSEAQKRCTQFQKKRDQALLTECILSKAEETEHSEEVKKLMNDYHKADLQWIVKGSIARPDMLNESERHGFWYKTKSILTRKTTKKNRKEELRNSAFKFGADLKQWKDTCEKITPKHWSKVWFQRLKQEYSEPCSKSEDGTCSEKGNSYCPEGSACSCRRAQTPSRIAPAVLAGAVFSNLVVGTIGGLITVAGGAAGPPLAAFVGGFFGANAIVPDWPLYAAFGLAASRTLFKKCMCFHQDCVHDAETDTCKLKLAKTMNSTSNPLHYLPPSGLRCRSIRQGKCRMDSCSISDLARPPAEGQTSTNGGSLFGRVGRDGKDIFNCANTQGTMETLLSSLADVPSKEGKKGDTVPNSAKARVDILQDHPCILAPCNTTPEVVKSERPIHRGRRTIWGGLSRRLAKGDKSKKRKSLEAAEISKRPAKQQAMEGAKASKRSSRSSRGSRGSRGSKVNKNQKA